MGPPEAILDRFGVVWEWIWGGFWIDLDGFTWGALGRSRAMLAPPEAIFDRYGVVWVLIWRGFRINFNGFGVDFN